MYETLFMIGVYALFCFVIGVIVFYMLFVLLKGCKGRNFGTPVVTRHPQIFVVARTTAVTGQSPAVHSSSSHQNVIHTQAYPPSYPKDITVMPTAPPTYDEAICMPPPPMQSQQRTAS